MTSVYFDLPPRPTPPSFDLVLRVQGAPPLGTLTLSVELAFPDGTHKTVTLEVATNPDGEIALLIPYQAEAAGKGAATVRIMAADHSFDARPVSVRFDLEFLTYTA